MTEENDSIKNGLNGGAVNTISYAKNETLSVQSKPTIKKDNTSNDAAALQQTTLSGKTNVSPTTVGGRLQFFKDGKFILELAQSKEGERPGWVSVPRKTYWPPSVSSSNLVPFSKNESLTSLSISDDNSSIHSSPWHRERIKHVPKKNQSKELEFSYQGKFRKLHKTNSDLLRVIRRRGRQMNLSPLNAQELLKEIKDNMDKEHNGNGNGNGNGNENGKRMDDHSPTPAATNGNCKIKRKSGNTLDKIVENLLKTATTIPQSIKMSFNKQLLSGAIQNHLPTKLDKGSIHYHISPRKRILRELEKVSIDDSSSNTKRSRPKQSGSNGGAITSPLATSSGQQGSDKNSVVSNTMNGTSSTSTVAKNSTKSSSYSINSLLGDHKSSQSPDSRPNSNTSVDRDCKAIIFSSQSNDKHFNHTKKPVSVVSAYESTMMSTQPSLFHPYFSTTAASLPNRESVSPKSVHRVSNMLPSQRSPNRSPYLQYMRGSPVNNHPMSPSQDSRSDSRNSQGKSSEINYRYDHESSSKDYKMKYNSTHKKETAGHNECKYESPERLDDPNKNKTRTPSVHNSHQSESPNLWHIDGERRSIMNDNRIPIKKEPSIEQHANMVRPFVVPPSYFYYPGPYGPPVSYYHHPSFNIAYSNPYAQYSRVGAHNYSIYGDMIGRSGQLSEPPITDLSLAFKPENVKCESLTSNSEDKLYSSLHEDANSDVPLNLSKH